MVGLTVETVVIEKGDPNQNPDSDIPNVLGSDAPVADDTNILSAPPVTPVKSPSKQLPSESAPVCNKPYVTRFGRVCKPKIRESM